MKSGGRGVCCSSGTRAATNAWGQVAKLTRRTRAAGSYFGQAVSVAGDVAWSGRTARILLGWTQEARRTCFERNAGGTNA